MRLLFLLLFCLFNILNFAYSDETLSTQPQVAPNPLHLEPGWWEYYAKPIPPFDEKIQKTNEELEKILESVDESYKKEVEILVRRVLTNLEAIPKIRDQSVKTFNVEPFNDAYTLEEELQIAQELRELKIKDEDFTKEKLRLNERYRKLSQHVDTLFASYLKMNEPTQEKLNLGLELMALRAGLQLNEDELQLIRQMADENSKAVDYKQNELEKAKQNLVVGQVDSKATYRKIEEAEAKLKNIQLIALRAETEALGPPGESLKERLDRSYLVQKASGTSANEALATVDLIFEKAKQAYFEFLENPSRLDIQETNEQLQKWKSALFRIKKQTSEWKAKLEEEVRNSGNIYAHLESDPDTNSQQLMRMQQSWYREVQQTLLALQTLDSKLYMSSLVLDQFSHALIQENSAWVVGWYKVKEFFTGCCNPFFDWMHSSLFKIGDVPLTPLSLLNIVLIMAMAYLASFAIRLMIRRMTSQHHWVGQSGLFLVNRLLHYLILIIGLSFALGSIGLNFSNLALVLGALSVGIGFGLQTIVNNFFSSLLIFFTSPFKIGDIIETTTGKVGKVLDITVQHTVIHTGDGIDVIVPNSEMISKHVINWTMQDGYMRKHIPFTVAYGTDKELVCRVIEEAALKVPCTVKGFEQFDDPKVWLVKLGDVGLDFELVVWVNICGYGHRGDIDSSYVWEVESALREHHIEIPSQQWDLNLRSSVPLQVIQVGAP